MWFQIHTLGCKLNQLETEAITDAFTRNGFNPNPDLNLSCENGIAIVNTCTVTSMAEQKARRLIRKLLNDYPAACVIVTGCYAQMDKEIIENEFGERVFVLRGENKDRLLDLPAYLAKVNDDSSVSSSASLPSVLERFGVNSSSVDASFRFRPEKFTSHSRGFMKIQDGCNRQCTYCRVRVARGKSRSLGAKEALAELQSLEERGFNEAVLTGVNITQYQDAGMDLAALLKFLLDGSKKIRIRLSSIDPDALDDRFFSVLSDKRIRPHFHLSLQSLNANILTKMGRAYTPPEIEKIVEKLRLVKEDPFLACDIIAAFPGETEEEFEETRSLCEKFKFSWIHAFPFSPRPGTAAYNLSGRIKESEAKRRVDILTHLAKKGRAEYIERWKGREVEAVIEEGKSSGHFLNAVSENYLKLLIDFSKNAPAPGSLVKCRIVNKEPNDNSRDAAVYADVCAELII